MINQNITDEKVNKCWISGCMNQATETQIGYHGDVDMCRFHYLDDKFYHSCTMTPKEREEYQFIKNNI